MLASDRIANSITWTSQPIAGTSQASIPSTIAETPIHRKKVPGTNISRMISASARIHQCQKSGW